MKEMIYCKKCGSPLNDNRKCTQCGKQYFKFKKSIFFTSLLVLTLISIISIETIYICYQENNFSKLENTYSTQLSNSEKEKIEIIEKLKKYIQYSYNGNNELDFFRNHAVIVSNNATKKYHNYGCEDLMLNRFWIYNIEAAEGNGYTMCKKCYQKETDTSNDILTEIDIMIDKMNYLNDSANSGDTAMKKQEFEKEQYFEKVKNGTNSSYEDYKAKRLGWIEE